jgi:hypothetical protein
MRSTRQLDSAGRHLGGTIVPVQTSSKALRSLVSMIRYSRALNISWLKRASIRFGSRPSLPGPRQAPWAPAGFVGLQVSSYHGILAKRYSPCELAQFFTISSASPGRALSRFSHPFCLQDGKSGLRRSRSGIRGPRSQKLEPDGNFVLCNLDHGRLTGAATDAPVRWPPMLPPTSPPASCPGS